MVSEKEQPAKKYICRTGTIHQYHELERVAWQHSTPTDLTDPPVKINGLQYYPITDNQTFLIEYTDDTDLHADMAVSPTLANKTTQRKHSPHQSRHSPRNNSNTRIQLTLVTPDGTRKRTLSAQQIISVKPINVPNTYFPIQSSTYPEQANELEKYAGIHPNTVDPERVISLLATDSRKETRRSAVAALRHIAPHRPSDCVNAVPKLKNVLANERVPQHSKRDVLYILSEIAKQHPRDVTTVTTVLTQFFQCSETPIRVSALQIAVSIARIDNTVYQGYENTFIEKLATNSLQEQLCVAELIATRASHTPSTLVSHTDNIVSHLTRDDVHVTTVATLLVALRHIAAHDPVTLLTHTNTVTEHVESHNEYVSANALSILHSIAQIYPEDVLYHTEDLVSLLQRDNEQILANVLAVIARLASTNPEKITPFTQELLTHVKHGNESIRLNTCCTLEHIGEHLDDTKVDTDALEKIASDPTEREELRSHAHWAIENITNTKK